MSNNTTTVTVDNSMFEADVARALEIYAGLRRGKGQRPQAVLSFLQVQSHEDREAVVEVWGAGFVRRGLREAAVYLERHDRQDEADLFWLLREDIDLETGEVFSADPEAEVTADEVA